jgi:hypothetical protein
MGNEIEQKVLKYCNDKCHGKRVVGMRTQYSKITFSNHCVVRYLDMFGTPSFEGGIPTKAVLFHGSTWESVLDQILASGWHEK